MCPIQSSLDRIRQRVALRSDQSLHDRPVLRHHPVNRRTGYARRDTLHLEQRWRQDGADRGVLTLPMAAAGLLFVAVMSIKERLRATTYPVESKVLERVL